MLVMAASVPPGLHAQEDPDEDAPEPIVCDAGTGGSLLVGLAGMVRDEESEVPLPGATVVIRFDDAPGRETPAEVTVQADDEGYYEACGLEAFHRIRVRATYSARRGDERRLELERSQHLDLEVDMGDAAFLVFSVVAQDDSRPVEGARVELSPLPVAGVTDSLGRVAFRAVPPGDYGLHVEHIAFAPRDEEIDVGSDQMAEFRVELITQAIALEPIEVRVTGRDPYLLTSGFYERAATIDGYFGTAEEIESYRMMRTLFQFKPELSIRFRRRPFILLDGRPARRLGFETIGELNEIKFSRVRGIEAYSCSDAPPSLLSQLDIELPIGDCNLIAIWTR